MSAQVMSQAAVAAGKSVFGPFAAPAENLTAYLVDAAQRGIPYWDAMRERNNQQIYRADCADELMIARHTLTSPVRGCAAIGTGRRLIMWS